MTENKTIFELKQEFDNTKNIAAQHIQNTFEFYNFANRELLDYTIKINRKLFAMARANLASSEAMAQLRLKMSKEDREMMDKIESVPADYSPYNIIVWIKRYYSFYEDISKDVREEVKYSQYLLKCLKEIHDQLEPYKHMTAANEILNLLDVLRSDLLTTTTFKLELFDCWTFLEQLFVLFPTISKNDFLSLISINKDKETIDIINSMPDQLTFEGMTEAIFMENIEDDDNSYLFDFMFEHLMKLRKSNKELKKEMDKRIGLDNIPSFSIKNDEFGIVTEVKQNPPKLRLV